MFDDTAVGGGGGGSTLDEGLAWLRLSVIIRLAVDGDTGDVDEGYTVELHFWAAAVSRERGTVIRLALSATILAMLPVFTSSGFAVVLPVACIGAEVGCEQGREQDYN